MYKYEMVVFGVEAKYIMTRHCICMRSEVEMNDEGPRFGEIDQT